MHDLAVYLNHPVVSAWDITAEQAGELQSLFPRHPVRICRDEAGLLAALPSAEIVLTWTFRQEWFARAPYLRVVATPAAGRDYFQVEWPPGVRAVNGQFHGALMAETAVGLLLAMTRGLFAAVHTYRDLPWPRREVSETMRPLRGSRVLILGFGHIGQWIGRLLKPFGVTIRGIRRQVQAPRPDWFAAGDAVVGPEDLEAELPLSDHVVVVLPADKTTDSLLDRRRLALLPAHATLVNLGRGNCLDEEALMDMLREGRLAGASLDVMRQEPLPADSPLRDCPRLWLFPHSSAISPNYLNLFFRDFRRQWPEAD